MRNIVNFVIVLTFLYFVKIKLILAETELVFVLNNGEHINLRGEISEFSIPNNTNVWCTNGVWIFYRQRNFRTYAYTLKTQNYRCNSARSSWKPGSIRSIGDTSYYSEPTVYLFSMEKFQGIQTVVNPDGLPILETKIRSWAHVNADFELFQETNFTGESYCVLRPEFCRYKNVCLRSNWRLLKDFYKIPKFVTNAKSVKIGCSKMYF